MKTIYIMNFFCVDVMYSGEYDACDVTLSVYPHRASFKNMPGHGGNRTYDLWNILEEHWASIPKVVGSIPTVARHIFQACPMWIYTQSNITSIIYIMFLYSFQSLCKFPQGIELTTEKYVEKVFHMP